MTPKVLQKPETSYRQQRSDRSRLGQPLISVSGVRPIAIGEELRRIVCKALAFATGSDVAELCGVSQLCSGLEAGIEGAVHAIRELFEDNRGSCWGVLLVDAKNAFNSLNRAAALWNGSSESILSKEGVSQGDPLSMLMYAAALTPLIASLTDLTNWSQCWYADDSACAAIIPKLREWFDNLCNLGPAYGYYPEPQKTVVVVDEVDKAEANACFGDIGVKVSRESQPQAAYAALSKSLQFEWSYLQRVLPNFGTSFAPLRDVINKKFWPSVFGGQISNSEQHLFSLPTRLGGMGIFDPVELANVAYTTSRACTNLVVDAIKNNADFVVSSYSANVRSVKTEKHKELAMMQTMECDSVLVSLGNDTRRAVQRAIDGKTSAWLTVMPIACHHFDLSSVEFRDALSLRYHRPLLKTPGHCDGCGEEFSFQHALDCKKGGLVTQRHNEVRDALGDLAAIVYKDVVREPIVQEADDSSGRPALIADRSIRGVWQPQTAALLDVRVVDTDAQSYASRTVDAVLCSAEQEKKRKYSAAVEDRRASFTPFVVSVDGVLGHDAQHLMKRLCDQIAVKWEKSHSEVMGWVRARMAFAILRATNLCLRGSRVKWRSGHGMDDGAGLPHFPH
eukprot:Em0019g1069a